MKIFVPQSAKVMEVTIKAQAITYNQQPADTTQFIATPYNEAKLFLSAIPTSAFEGSLIPTAASYKLQLNENQIFEYFSNDMIYILVHAVQQSKKSKAGEYQFSPICGYVAVSLTDIIPQIKLGKNQITINQKQKISFYNQTLFGDIELQFNVVFNFEITAILEAFSMNLNKVTIFGNLKNLPQFPSFGWNANFKIGDRVFPVCSNGFLQKSPQKLVGKIEKVQDILNLQPISYQLVFEDQTSKCDLKALERGIQTLAEATQDAKNAEKWKQAEVASQSSKLIGILNSQYNLGIVQPKSKEQAPEHSLHAALLFLREQLTNMYQMQDKTGKLKISLVTDAIDVQTFPLVSDKKINVGYQYFLTCEQLRALRNERCYVEIVNPLFENSAAVCDIALGPLLRERDRIKLSGLVLKMTESQAELIQTQARSLAASATDKKAVNKKDAPVLYQNPLVSNFAVADLALDFSATRISLSEDEVAAQFSDKIIELHTIYQSIRNEKPLCQMHSLILKSSEENYLPPAKTDQNLKQQILQCFKQEIINIYGSQSDEKLIKQQLQQTMKYYNNELQNQQPNGSLTERHALLMNHVKDAIDEYQIHKNSVENLLTAAEQLRNEPANAIKLFGQALVRERSQMGSYITTKNLERSLVGLLKCSMGIGEQKSIERQLIRIISIARQAEVRSVQLLIYSVNMLVHLGVDFVFIISFINEFKGALDFDETITVEELIYPKLLLLICFEQLNYTEQVEELRYQLASYVRGHNNLLSMVDKTTNNYCVCELLKLGLCEDLLLNGFARIPELVIQCLNFEKLFAEKQVVIEPLIIHSVDGSCTCELCLREKNEPKAPKPTLEDLVLSFKTKTAVVQARIFLCQNQNASIKNVLLKPQFSQKQSVAHNGFSLLSYLQSDEEPKASYLDLIDTQLDTSCPGLLLHLAMAGWRQHKVPSLLIRGDKLARVIVCGAVQGRFPNKGAMNLSQLQIPGTGKEQKQVIPGMVISDDAQMSLANLSSHTIFFNSRVAFDMLLQGFCASRLSPGTHKRFDCSVLLGFDVLKDELIIQEICRLANRYLPMFEILSLLPPYGGPSEDEHDVARRIYRQLEPFLRPSTLQIEKEQFSFTNDYLSVITPQVSQEILDLVTPLIQQLLKSQFSSSNCATYGLINLLRKQQQLAFGCFQKALQMCSTTPTAWIGLAVCFATQISETKDRNVQEKLRNKIVECIGRIKLDQIHNQQALMVIAGALLDPHAEKATLFALTAQKLLKQLQPLPQVTPVVVFTDVAYQIDFSRQKNIMSIWHERRLQAVAAVSCGRPFEVAQFLEQALQAIAGIKPGRDIEEMAQRILLMIEASQAYKEAQQFTDSDRIMNQGLH